MSHKRRPTSSSGRSGSSRSRPASGAGPAQAWGARENAPLEKDAQSPSAEDGPHDESCRPHSGGRAARKPATAEGHPASGPPCDPNAVTSRGRLGAAIPGPIGFWPGWPGTRSANSRWSSNFLVRPPPRPDRPPPGSRSPSVEATTQSRRPPSPPSSWPPSHSITFRINRHLASPRALRSEGIPRSSIDPSPVEFAISGPGRRRLLEFRSRSGEYLHRRFKPQRPRTFGRDDDDADDRPVGQRDLLFGPEGPGARGTSWWATASTRWG